MAAPNPQPCSKADCDYITPTGLTDWEMVTQHIHLHNEAVHQPIAHTPSDTTATRPTTHGAKLDKRVRPTAALA